MADAQNNIQATDDYASDLSVKEIITFFKLRKRRLLLRAGISFVLMLLVFLLLYAFTPRNAIWSRNITLLLPRNDNVPLYPSGKPFSTSDLLTPSVLREVYNANNLKGRIDFADFMSSFFMSDSNMEKTRLDAEYREKMNKRNISVIDLQNLEHEYRQKLQSLASEQLALSMKPEMPLSRVEITKILNSIPEVWFIATERVEKSYWKSSVLETEALNAEIREGLEQGVDTVWPELHFYRHFREFLEESAERSPRDAIRIVAHPGRSAADFQRGGRHVVLAVGPEGGFVKSEIEALAAAGFEPMGFGGHILRVEFAAAFIAGFLMGCR